MIALDKDPQRRFASVSAFANAFEQASLLEEETVRARPDRYPLLETSSPTELMDDPSTVRVEDRDSELLDSTLVQTPDASQSHSSATIETSSVQREPRRHRRLPLGRIVLLLALVVLVIASSFGLAYYTTVLHPAQLRAQVTATAQAIHTVQAMATARARQDVYTKATSGAPVFNDPLNQDDNQWAVRKTEEPHYAGSCAFTGGAFHVIASQPEDFVPCYHGGSFDNFAYQVQMTIIKGDEGGIYFRQTNTTDYIFSINHNGLYTLETLQNTNILLLHRSDSAIKTDLNQINILTVVAIGKSIFLFVNREYVADVHNDASTSGGVGVFAFAGQDPTEVAFSNVQIWKL